MEPVGRCILTLVSAALGARSGLASAAGPGPPPGAAAAAGSARRRSAAPGGAGAPQRRQTRRNLRAIGAGARGSLRGPKRRREGRWASRRA